MENLLQTDLRWRKLKLGSGSATIGQAGCAITALCQWLNWHYQTLWTPRQMNAVLNDADGGYYNSNLLNWGLLPRIFPGLIEYRGRADWQKVPAKLEEIAPYLPAIIYVNFTPAARFSQHFVLLKTMSGELIDPMYGALDLCPRYGPSPQVAICGFIKLTEPE